MSSTFERHPGVCRFTYADGRLCRMLISASHSYLCPSHALKESQAVATQHVGRRLAATLSHDFITACDLTAAMSQLFGAIAQGHIKPRTANTLAYVGQTISQTLRLSQQEFIAAYGAQTWRAAIRDAITTANAHTNPPDDTTTISEITPVVSALTKVCENT
jgi:hypothetical protein